MSKFQERVQPWLMACFGEMIAGDREERNHRFLEEALELVQACGCTASEAHQLVDYVYGRDIGEPAQEVGGVMVTLAALCLANGLDMHANGETELARIWTKVEAIRAKQAAKPKHSPLPALSTPKPAEPACGAFMPPIAGWEPIGWQAPEVGSPEDPRIRATPAVEALREAINSWWVSDDADIRGRWAIRCKGKTVEYVMEGRDEAYERMRGLRFSAALTALTPAEPAGEADLHWAVEGWKREVEHRPLVNIHRRSLDDVWRQAIRRFGGDPDKLVGSCHDVLLEYAALMPAAAAETGGNIRGRGWKPDCPKCVASKFTCDEHYTPAAAGSGCEG